MDPEFQAYLHRYCKKRHTARWYDHPNHADTTTKALAKVIKYALRYAELKDTMDGRSNRRYEALQQIQKYGLRYRRLIWQK